jgi:histidinol-phosphate aminotransferase
MFVRADIAAMSGYTPGEQPQGGKFIKLNTNENPYPPSPAVMRTIAAVSPQNLMRYPDPLASAFRIRAAEIYARAISGITPAWILCGNGSDDLLTIVTRSLVGAGEMLRLPYPSYVLYKTLAQIQGARFEEVRFNADWSLPEEFSRPADGLRLAFLPNPNSPTGTMVPRERVLTIAERLPCPLLVDEAYADFADENCLELVAKSEKIMVSRTLSKSHALAGLRFGYLIAQPHLIEQFVKVKDSYNCDAISIAAATAAIDDQAWLAETRAKVIATRGRLVAGLAELRFNVVPSQANFVWCVHERVAAKTIYERLKSSGVLVRYMNYPDWGDGLRISVGTDSQIDACLSLIQEIV